MTDKIGCPNLNWVSKRHPGYYVNTSILVVLINKVEKIKLAVANTLPTKRTVGLNAVM